MRLDSQSLDLAAAERQLDIDVEDRARLSFDRNPSFAIFARDSPRGASGSEAIILSILSVSFVSLVYEA